MTKKKGTIRDLDKVLPGKRIAKLAGEEIDLTTVSMRASIELARFADEREKLSGAEQMAETIRIVTLICAKNSKIDEDWLLDNTDVDTLTALVDFALESMQGKIDKENESGEEQASAKESDES